MNLHVVTLHKVINGITTEMREMFFVEVYVLQKKNVIITK